MEAGNDRRVPPPDWINDKFIESALTKKEHTKVVCVDVKHANAPGAGFGSVIFRVTASVKDKDDEETKKSLVVKANLSPVVSQELLEEMKAFSKESLMLDQVMPQVHAILESAEGSSAFRPLTAQCYHTGQQPADFLVLEDLAAAGFRLAKAGEPLDWQHCAVVLRAYARLHAASALLLKRQPQYRDSLASNIFTGQHTQKTVLTMASKLLGAVAEQLEQCPGYEKYSSKYRTCLERYEDLEYEAIKRNRNESKLTVINHGDCWKNNFMFKYVDGDVSEVRLVDFQISTVTSPAADLQYFLFTNPSEDVHRHHLDRLLHEYHGTLTGLLRRLGLEEEADAYTFQELQDDMDRCSLLAVLFSGLSCITLLADKLAAEIHILIAEPEHADDTCAKLLRNPYSLPYMKYLSTVFEKRGIW